MNELLLVIDLQKSFINQNTEFLIEKIEKLINSNRYQNIIFTRFINSFDSIWYKKLNYKGCITDEEKKLMLKTQHKVIDKYIYSAYSYELKNYLIENNIEKVYLCGIDTECCILKTALDLFENNIDTYVLKDYCGCTHCKDYNDNALRIIGRCIGRDKII